MAFVKKPFPITAHWAEALSRTYTSGISNWDITRGDYAPFTAIWPETNVFAENTRYVLPALVFKGQVVAQLGYRNKEGFMFIRDGIGTRAEKSLINHFQQMMNDAMLHTSLHDYNILRNKESVKLLITQSPILDTVKGDASFDDPDVKMVSFPKELLVHSVVKALRREVNVMFNYTGTKQEGRLDLAWRGGDATYLPFGSYSWKKLNGQDVFSVAAQDPLSTRDMVIFAVACVRKHLGQVGVARDIDTAQLDNEIGKPAWT